MLVLPVIYIATIIFIPETPVFLIKTNRRKVSSYQNILFNFFQKFYTNKFFNTIQEAEESLKFFKNCKSSSKEDVDRFNEELNKLLIFVEKTNSTVDTVKIADFCKKYCLIKKKILTFHT